MLAEINCTVSFALAETKTRKPMSVISTTFFCLIRQKTQDQCNRDYDHDLRAQTLFIFNINNKHFRAFTVCWGFSELRHPQKNSLLGRYSPLWALWDEASEPRGSDSKEPCTVREIRVWSLGQEDPLEEGMATYSSILAWGIPWTEELVGFSPKHWPRLSDSHAPLSLN